MATVQGHTAGYDPIPGDGQHKSAESIPREGRHVQVLQSSHDIATRELGLPEKHCQVPFGAYVQACHETDATNSIMTCTLDAIYLCPVSNEQGGHKLVDHNSG